MTNCETAAEEKKLSLQEQLEAFEKNLIKELMLQCSTAYEVSKILQVNRSTISKKIKKYGIEVEH